MIFLFKKHLEGSYHFELSIDKFTSGADVPIGDTDVGIPYRIVSWVATRVGLPIPLPILR